MSVYLDTSVVVSSFVDETNTARAQAWLSANAGRRLVVSDWVSTEVSAALSMKVRAGKINERLRAELLAEYGSLASSTFVLLPVERVHFQSAGRLADNHGSGLRASDALHLAVVLANGISLCSLDEGLANAGRMAGIAVEIP